LAAGDKAGALPWIGPGLPDDEGREKVHLFVEDIHLEDEILPVLEENFLIEVERGGILPVLEGSFPLKLDETLHPVSEGSFLLKRSETLHLVLEGSFLLKRSEILHLVLEGSFLLKRDEIRRFLVRGIDMGVSYLLAVVEVEKRKGVAVDRSYYFYKEKMTVVYHKKTLAVLAVSLQTFAQAAATAEVLLLEGEEEVVVAFAPQAAKRLRLLLFPQALLLWMRVSSFPLRVLLLLQPQPFFWSWAF
jgi:hypothetical protein